MAQIGTLLTGAGVTTVIQGQAQCEAIIVLGTVATANPLQGMQVEIDGQSVFNVQGNAGLLSAYFKWLGQFAGTIVPNALKIATGSIPLNTTYRLTNAGATTPAIFAFSDNDNGVPFAVGTTQINASAYQDFSKFSALFIAVPGSVSSVEFTFTNGKKSTLSTVECDALFSLKKIAEASGQLGGVTVIDNTDQSIQMVRINATVAVVILVAKLPQTAWDMIKQ